MTTCFALGTTVDTYGGLHHATLRALHARSSVEKTTDFEFVGRPLDLFQKISFGYKTIGIVPLGSQGSAPLIDILAPWLDDKPVPFHLTGELRETVSYCLAVHRETHQAEDLNVVLSDPLARLRCTSRLDELKRTGIGCQQTPDMQTAIQTLLDKHGSTTFAAVMTRFAADRHDLAMLQEDVQDGPADVLRYGILGHQLPKPTGHDKTVLLLRSKHLNDTLRRLSDEAMRSGVELHTVHTLDLPKHAKAIYVECSGHIKISKTRHFVEKIQRDLCPVSVLGSFPFRASN